MIHCPRCGAKLNQASFSTVHFEESLMLSLSDLRVPSFTTPICDECARDIARFLYPTLNGGERVTR